MIHFPLVNLEEKNSKSVMYNFFFSLTNVFYCNLHSCFFVFEIQLPSVMKSPLNFCSVVNSAIFFESR